MFVIPVDQAGVYIQGVSKAGKEVWIERYATHSNTCSQNLELEKKPSYHFRNTHMTNHPPTSRTPIAPYTHTRSFHPSLPTLLTSQSHTRWNDAV